MHGRPLATLLLLLSSPAYAESADDAEQRYFFSNVSLDRAQILTDWDECRDLASMVRPPETGSVYAPGLAGAAAAGFLKGLIQGAQRRHMFDASLRKCMSIKGYQRYMLSKPDYEALYTGKWPELREKLADRAVSPVGEAVRLDP